MDAIQHTHKHLFIIKRTAYGQHNEVQALFPKSYEETHDSILFMCSNWETRFTDTVTFIYLENVCMYYAFERRFDFPRSWSSLFLLQIT